MKALLRSILERHRCGWRLAAALFAFANCTTSLVADPSPAEYSLSEYWVAPLRVHLLVAEDEPAFCTTLTVADIDRIITKANRIWSQAGIGFYVESVVSEIPAAAESELDQHRFLLSRIPSKSYSTEAFNIYYLKDFDVNGIYFAKAIFVKDTAALRRAPGGIDEPLPRVTAHELGHALGLIHRQDTFNLMASGTTGTSLNANEIAIARETAAASGRFGRAGEWLAEADALFDAGKVKEAGGLYRRLFALPLGPELAKRVRARSAK